jgi:plasmid stabilization system protein ParE
VNVIISEEAEADLIRIGDYIALDNPRRSISFVSELLDKCRSLADMPSAFPLVPRYEHFGIRRRQHGDYLIFYRIGETQIDVIHILNGAQNYENILFPDNE